MSFLVKQANRVVYRLHLGKTTGIMLIKVNAFSCSPARELLRTLLKPKATIVVVAAAGALLMLLYPIAILPPSSS